LATEEASVKYKENELTQKDLIRKIEETGYTVAADKEDTNNTGEKEDERKMRKARNWVIFSFAFTIPAWGLMFGNLVNVRLPVSSGLKSTYPGIYR